MTGVFGKSSFDLGIGAYGSLNVTDPCNLIGSGSIGRYGFVGVGMTLLRGSVSLWRWTLRFPMLRIPLNISVD